MTEAARAEEAKIPRGTGDGEVRERAEEMGVIMCSNLGVSHWCGELGAFAGRPHWPF